MPLFTAIRIFSRLLSHSHCSRLRSILLAPMERPPPIPALGHFRPLALEDLPQRDIHDPLESPLLGIEGKGKTGGIDIERLQ